MLIVRPIGISSLSSYHGPLNIGCSDVQARAEVQSADCRGVRGSVEEIRHEEIAPIDLPKRRVHYMQLLQMDHWRQDEKITPGCSLTKRSVGLEKRFFLTNSWQGCRSPPKAEEQVSYSQHNEEAKSA